LGEADRIIAFHTEDFGNVRAVARGVRKVKSRLCGRLEILTFGSLVFYERPGKDLHVVNSFDVIESFQTLREDLMKMAYCSYLAELVQHVGSQGESESDSDMFALLLVVMSMMKDADDPEVLARVFEIRLLTSAGLSPQLDFCLECSCEIDNAASLGFSVARGGILCSECKDTVGQTTAFPISRGTVELMKRMRQTPLELISRLRILENNRRELRKVLKNFISFHIDIGRLRSLDFLASIEDDVMLKA
jgi:DNA repair protein RecO (recombination protein O)